MKHIKPFFIVYIIMSLWLLCSCDKGGNDLRIEVSSPHVTLVDLSSKTYDKSQLLKISKFEGKINELNAEYPIECLRSNKNIYRASYLGDGFIAVILFDNFGNKVDGNIYGVQQLKANFNGLAEGVSLEKVRNIDPNGEYLFLYTGRDDTPKISYHYTKDGYLITIEYDESNKIIDINEELI